MQGRATANSSGEPDVSSSRADERTLSTTLRAAPIGIGLVTNRILGWTNDQLGQMLGYSAEELDGMPARTLYENDEEYERVGRVKHERIRVCGSGAVETRMVRKDRVALDVLLSSAAIDRDDLSKGLVFTVMDITERKASMLALRQSEERYRALADNYPNGALFLLDRELRCISASGQALAAHGLVPENVIGRGIEEVFGPEAQDRVRTAVHAAATAAASPIEIRLRHRVYSAHVVPIRNEQGSITQVCLIAQDVTQQRALEEQVRQTQKMEAIGQLAGGVAHDFNNILTAILGNVDLLGMQLRKRLAADDPVFEVLRQAERSGQRAAALTRQLLAFSRKSAAHPEVLDPKTLLGDVEKLLRRLIPENVQLVIEVADDVGHIHADAGQFEQVLLNLVVNARDAMPSGGVVRVTVENHIEQERRDALAYSAGAVRFVRICVEDTGHGMDEATLDRIFEPFFTTKSAGAGTGLGLATVQSIVRDLHGSITAESTPDAGSTFTVLLSAVDSAQEIRTETVGASGVLRGRETVLVCEDDASVRDLISVALRANGYDVLSAEHGANALLSAAEHDGPIDLLITDVVMPGMNGRELVERLANQDSRLRVLYISGYPSAVLRDYGVADAGEQLLVKPFRSEEMLRRVRDLLGAGAQARS